MLDIRCLSSWIIPGSKNKAAHRGIVCCMNSSRGFISLGLILLIIIGFTVVSRVGWYAINEHAHTAFFSAIPAAGPVPLKVNFTAPVGGVGYVIDFGNGVEGGIYAKDPSCASSCSYGSSYSYSSPGTYVAKLYHVDACGLTGCLPPPGTKPLDIVKIVVKEAAIQESATIDQTSLLALSTSSSLIITGSVSGTKSVGLMILSKSGNLLYKSELVAVSTRSPNTFWSINISSKLTAGSYIVEVYDANGKILTRGKLTVGSGGISIASISPSSGPIGTRITIIGSGLMSAKGYGFEILVDGNYTNNYISDLQPTDTSLTFVLGPNVTSRCPKDMLCQVIVAPLAVGKHTLAVENTNGTSNTVTFTVVQ